MSNKQDRINNIINVIEKHIKSGLTPQEAIEKLTLKQYDFLVDNDVNVDEYLLTKEQLQNVKNAKKVHRGLSPNGYNKKYPPAKIALYNNIKQLIETLGGNIMPREKENYRDLDFSINGTNYRIVLSNPTQKTLKSQN